MVKARHERAGVDGYITLETLVGETTIHDAALWDTDHFAALRRLVMFEWDGTVLYSTNRMSPKQVSDSEEYLSRFVRRWRPVTDSAVHPLQAGAHANRLGVWALDRSRSAAERERAARLIDAMFKRYAIPAMREIGSGAWAWPYP